MKSILLSLACLRTVSNLAGAQERRQARRHVTHYSAPYFNGYGIVPGDSHDRKSGWYSRDYPRGVKFYDRGGYIPASLRYVNPQFLSNTQSLNPYGFNPFGF